MNRLGIGATLLLMLLLFSAGCSLGLSRPALVKHYYLLDVAPKPADTPPAHPAAIRVTGFEVAAPFADRSLVYRGEQDRYEADFYDEFFVPPRAMVTSEVVEWLTVRRIFATTLPSSSSLDAPYAMEGLVIAMYGDLRNKAEIDAVFTMQVFVSHSGALDRSIVLERTYGHRVHVPDASADAISKGLSQAFEQCLVDLESDLRALQLNP
jgi:cholesterol transport system auxiliary component